MKKVFAIRDVKVSAYHLPFFAENEIMAVRSIQAHMTNGESFLSQFAPDYELYHLGEFDEIQGKFILLDHPKFIISCQSIMLNILKATQVQQKLAEIKESEKVQEKEKKSEKIIPFAATSA